MLGPWIGVKWMFVTVLPCFLSPCQAGRKELATTLESDVMARLVQVAFSDTKVLDQWKLQLQVIQAGMSMWKHEEKFMKLGRDAASRIKADIRLGHLFGYLKIAESLYTAFAKIEKMAQPQDTSHTPKSDLRNVPELGISEAMADTLMLVSTQFEETATKLMTNLSDITHDKHHGEDSWKATLPLDAGADMIKTTAALSIGSLNMENLDPTLKSLAEA